VLAEPVLTTRHENGREVPLLLWRTDIPLLAISSAPLGGGIGVRRWLVNATVPMSYDRDDPDVHLADLADRLGLRGPGIGLLTGVDVAEVVAADDGGVRLWATVGLSAPIQAAAPAPAGPCTAPPQAGTVNIVAFVPARLADAALVNAVATITEAKVQALAELGLAATGTATDAVTVLCAPDGPVSRYGGPRSDWGAPLARAAHRAVVDGGRGGPQAVTAWSDRFDR
jgi:adenosylcobinamide hydrolase